MSTEIILVLFGRAAFVIPAWRLGYMRELRFCQALMSEPRGEARQPGVGSGFARGFFFDIPGMRLQRMRLPTKP